MSLYYPFIRPPAVAGMFYPADPASLRRDVERFVEAGGSETGAGKRAGRGAGRGVGAGEPPPALIGPHAGYPFSGPVAGSVYARLAGHRDAYERVVLIGPSHRVAFEGIAASSAESFETPLGRVPVDREASDRACREHAAVRQLDKAHAQEHGLEVHLPFLQVALGDFTILPLVVGRTGSAAVAEVLGPSLAAPGTLVVVSSDLSHYHDYETACRLDRRTSEAICAGEHEALTPERACGALPIAGLLRSAAERNLARPELLDLRNSGDTAGSRDRVVGYGAYLMPAGTNPSPASPPASTP